MHAVARAVAATPAVANCARPRGPSNNVDTASTARLARPSGDDAALAMEQRCRFRCHIEGAYRRDGRIRRQHLRDWRLGGRSCDGIRGRRR